MQGKIALEEHFAIPETLDGFTRLFSRAVWEEVKSRVMDIQERRLAEMDRHGIEMMLLSLNAPAVQAIPDPAQAADIARKANDYLAEAGAKAAGSIPGSRGACHARPGRGRAGTGTMRQTVRLPRRAG